MLSSFDTCLSVVSVLLIDRGILSAVAILFAFNRSLGGVPLRTRC